MLYLEKIDLKENIEMKKNDYMDLIFFIKLEMLKVEVLIIELEGKILFDDIDYIDIKI